MKIIELYTKLANGEEVPKKFTYRGYLWEYDAKSNTWFYYFGDSKNHRFDRLFYLNNILNDEIKIINDEVEILEEEKKIPEKLSTWFSVEAKQSKELNIEYANTNFENMYEKINEIIDYFKSKGDE